MPNCIGNNHNTEVVIKNIKKMIYINLNNKQFMKIYVICSIIISKEIVIIWGKLWIINMIEVIKTQ